MIPARHFVSFVVASALVGCHHPAAKAPSDSGGAAESAPTMHATATIAPTPFGVLPDGDSVEMFTLRNPHGMEVKVLSYGGIIQALKVPDRHGNLADVVLGFDSLNGYLHNSPYFGALIGRYANRIAKGHFVLDGKAYQLDTNNGANALHGGNVGFDKVNWKVDSIRRDDSTVALILSHTSPDGDQHYPGTVSTVVTYMLYPDNTFEIVYSATASAPTIVNLTQHSYFNLAGAGNGDILHQTLMVNADSYTPVDSTLIPTGQIAPVAGTPFDFRTPAEIGARINDDNVQLKHGTGYDHNFVLNHHGDDTVLAARLSDSASGRVLSIYTTQPGLQVYSGNFLDGTLKGTDGKRYPHRGGIALETQHFPDSPNHRNFPSTVLRPDHNFKSVTRWVFSVMP